MAEKIDAHHHLWKYTEEDYPWISEQMEVLRRDFNAASYAKERVSAQVHGSVVVQARQTIAETDWLLGRTHEDPSIRGVVGWLPLSSSWFPTLLQKYVSHPKLRGLRHVAHGKADPDFLLSENFNRGIRTLTASGLTYDVPIREAQWSDAVHFMARHPDQVFVVDRLLRPLMGSVPSAEWVCFVRRLAAMPNVCCKLTGLVTEADWSGQTLAKLAPCLDVVLDAFGAERVMAASEWPVCLLATTYEQWWATLKMWAEALSDSEQVSIFGDTAKRVYRLETRRTLQKPASGLDVVRPGLYPHASWIGA